MTAADWLTSEAMTEALAHITRKEMKTVYLGDSVYANFDGYQITLSTDNGDGPENEIVLEPQIIEALILFLSSLDNRSAE